MRPLNLGETLDASIKVVRRSWRTLAAVMIVIALPIQLCDLLIISSTTDTYQVGSSAFDTSAATPTAIQYRALVQSRRVEAMTTIAKPIIRMTKMP